MPAYEGGCHCNTVRFTISLEPTRLIDCNCSICTKKGVLHIPVEDAELAVNAGETALSLYQFGSDTARHWFCQHCGIHVFGRPRTAPHRYSVNARCMDDFHEHFKNLPMVSFDGVHHPADEVG